MAVFKVAPFARPAASKATSTPKPYEISAQHQLLVLCRMCDTYIGCFPACFSHVLLYRVDDSIGTAGDCNLLPLLCDLGANDMSSELGVSAGK